MAIDEFQTITDYPEQGTEALLRSHIQFIHNAHFIFSGSKMHLMKSDPREKDIISTTQPGYIHNGEKYAEPYKGCDGCGEKGDEA